MNDEVVDLENYTIPVLPTCDGCGRDLIARAHWKKAGNEERQDMLDEGYVRERRDGLCRDCLGPARSDKLTDADREVRRHQRGRTVREYREHRARGLTTTNEIADAIGITPHALRRSLARARRNGEDLP